MLHGYGPDPVDPELENRFWEYVRTGEDAEPRPPREVLAERGWSYPRPSKLSDDELPAMLERLVLDLAWIHVYLYGCDHVSDRELYEELHEWTEEAEIYLWPEDPGSAITLSFVRDDHDSWLRYYADESERARSARIEPDRPMPPSELPPYPRPWIPIRPIFD